MPSASNNNNLNPTKLVKQSSSKTVTGGVSSSGKNYGTTNSYDADVTSKHIQSNSAENIWQSKVMQDKKSNSAGANQGSKEQDIPGTIENVNTITSTNTNRESNDILNPMKMTITTIEHKIRNLEKRKTKLESYRAIQASGKELSSDQRAAVAKFDAVTATLEFARDLVKQMQQFSKDAEKEHKKQIRKDLIAKAQAETIKIREVLIIQNVLSCFTDDTIRNDFINGENGATKLEASEMDLLEKFCFDVQTRRPETSEDSPFATTAQKAAEIFSMTIDGRPKQYANTTFENVRRLFQRIQESNYLDKIYMTDGPIAEQLNEEADVQRENDVAEVEGTTYNLSDLAILEKDTEKSGGDHVKASFVTDTSDSVVLTTASAPIQQDLQASTTQSNQHMLNLPGDVSSISQTLLQPTPMAPPATAVPAFQTISPALPPSENSTPVHVSLLNHQTPMPATDQQQISQLSSNTIINGVPQSTGAILTGTGHSPNQQIANYQRPLLKNSIQSGVTPVSHLQTGTATPLHGAFNPTPVHTVEQSFFKQHQQQQQQFLQQIHPLADVIGGGNFYFLQESELDSPDPNGTINQTDGQNTLVYDQQPLTVNCVTAQVPLQNLKPSQLLNNNDSDYRNCPSEQTQQQPTQNSVLITQQSADTLHQTPQPSSLQTHIQSQTFTNQSFPQIPPSGSINIIGNSNASSVLFQPQSQQQQKLTKSTQYFSHVDVDTVLNPSGAQILKMSGNEQALQVSQQPMINMSHLSSRPALTAMLNNQQQSATQSSNAPGPDTLCVSNIAQTQQNQQSQLLASPASEMKIITDKDVDSASKNTRFVFENQLSAAVDVLKNVTADDTKISNTHQLSHPLNESKQIPQFLESSVTSEVVNEDNMLNSNPHVKEQKTWSNDSNDSITQGGQLQQQQQQSQLQSQVRKNEWSPSVTNNTSVKNADNTNDNSNYGNCEVRIENNPWHSQAEIIPQSGYSKGSRNSGNYDRRNRDDRRAGGPASANNYRGNRSNYGSTAQQNSGTRGTGMYFRNNDNGTNSYYQNGSNSGGHSYSAHKEAPHRFENCSVPGNTGGNPNFRGLRNNTGNNNSSIRYNASSTRSLGSNRNSNNTSGLNSTSFINSRQSHSRIPSTLAMDKKN